MTKQTKRSVLLAAVIAIVLILGVGGYLVVQRLNTTEPVAPTVGTQAQAGSWKTSNACKTTFQIGGAGLTCTSGFSYGGSALLPDSAFQTTNGGTAPKVKSGKIQVALPKKKTATTTTFTSRDTYSANFQYTVDVNPITVGKKDTGSGGIRVFTDDNNFYQLSISREANVTKINSWVKKGSSVDSQVVVTSGDIGTAARLVVKREEGKISMYYATGGNLGDLKLVTLTDNAFADPVKVQLLSTAKANNAGTVTVNFANFALTCPVPIPTSTPTPTGAPTATPTPTETPEPTETPTGAPTNTPTATPTPLASCSVACTDDSDCRNGLSCESGLCRNPQCSEVANCSCPTAQTPTNTPAPETPEDTIAPTQAQLPEAGFGLPTIGALGGGVVLMLLGILLAL